MSSGLLALAGPALGLFSLAGPSQALTLTCGTAPYDAPPAVASLVDSFQPVLDVAPSLADALGQKARAVCLAHDLHDARGYLEADTLRIVIADDIDRPLQQAVLIHELRHLQQQEAGTCPAPGLSMQENARAIFAMEAASSAFSMVVAWKMREAGHPEIWQALAEWPMQSDIAAAFAGEMDASGAVGLAAAAAFSQWYAKQARRDLYYIAACSDYLEQMDRTHRFPTYGVLEPDLFGRLCRLPDGTPFPCAEPE